jgi:chemotaxis response regulator CheB
MNASGTQRIVVLGHEGHARDQLVTALSDLGAAPVWVGTPSQSDPSALSTLNPNRLVISLDPTIELELEPYGDLLGQPGITVLFDDAETTRGLSGWDLNRWARHLAAKLLGRSELPAEHGPRAATVDDAGPVDALVDASVTVPVGLESVAEAAEPVEPVLAAAASEPVAPTPVWQDDGEYDSLEFDPNELEAALQQLDRNLSSSYSADEVKAANFEKLEPLSEQEQSAFRLDVEDSAPPATDAPAVAEPDFIPMPPPDNFDPPVMSVRGVPDEGPVEPTDDDLKRLIAEAEGLENRLIPDDVPLASDAPAFDTRAAASEIRPDVVPEAPKPRVFDLSQFSLVEDGAPMPTAEPPSPVPPAVPAEAVAPSFSTGFGLAEQGAAEDSADNEGRLYLAISGIGGPGAVRSLVEAVPSGFTGILALSQQLADGQLARLCGQLQKVTAVPVRVCEPDEYLHAGTIYLMPPEYGILPSPLGYQCRAAGGLKPFIDEGDPESRILVLSGGNPDLAQPLIMAGMVSGNVRAQDPDSCYEPTLARELVNIGAPTLPLDGMGAWFT